MTRKEHKAAGNPIPSTFRMALTEMVLVTISPLLILFLVWYFIWLDEYRNDIFLNGLGPIRGWSCGETYPSAGYYLFISLVVASLCLYIPSLMFLVLDGYLEQRGTLQNYKLIYPSPRQKQTSISWRLYRKSIRMAFENTLIGYLTMQFLILPLMESRGSCDDLVFAGESSRPPSSSLSYGIFLLILRFVLTIYTADIIFYFTHRTCHEVKWLYQRVHKIHHQFVDTYGISATACHPLEHVLVNLFQVMGAPVVTGLPLIPHCVFVAMGCVATTLVHCGYGSLSPSGNFLINQQNLPHDAHHHYQNCEYGNGGSGICDWLFGTRFEDLYPKRYRQMQEEYGVFPETKKID